MIEAFELRVKYVECMKEENFYSKVFQKWEFVFTNEYINEKDSKVRFIY